MDQHEWRWTSCLFQVRRWYLTIIRLLNLIANIIASSTDVERSFSKGGQTVSRFRHSLDDESARASTVVGAWTTLDGAINRSEIVTLFKNKRSRKGAKRQKTNADDVIEIDD